ncbi:MAG: ParB/RepB/Spo0J family partition protein [Planctomycetes bacterium]|nr:ParB/RepB/Spo0J family partition protein [Planctomycetota bacterium]
MAGKQLKKRNPLEEGTSSPSNVIPFDSEKMQELRKVEGLQEEQSIRLIPVSIVDPNPEQPRGSVSLEEVKNLAKSVKEHGLIHPILVRQAEGGRFEIIAGERRYLAVKLAGRREIEARICDLTGRTAREIAIVENFQRRDLPLSKRARAVTEIYEEEMRRLRTEQAGGNVEVREGWEAVAGKLDISARMVRKYLSVDSLPAPTLVECDKEGWSVAKAASLASERKGKSPRVSPRVGVERVARTLEKVYEEVTELLGEIEAGDEEQIKACTRIEDMAKGIMKTARAMTRAAGAGK